MLCYSGFVFICVDTLDECLSKCPPERLGSLRDIVHDSPAQEYFSPGASCLGDVQRYFAKAVVIPIGPNSDDIRNYVEMRLDRDAEHDLRAGIVRVIMEKISDMCV